MLDDKFFEDAEKNANEEILHQNEDRTEKLRVPMRASWKKTSDEAHEFAKEMALKADAFKEQMTADMKKLTELKAKLWSQVQVDTGEYGDAMYDSSTDEIVFWE